MRGKMLRCTGLWLTETAAGRTMLSGKWGNIRVVILENRKAEHKNDPTHILYFDEKLQDEERPEPGRRRAKPSTDDVIMPDDVPPEDAA